MTDPGVAVAPATVSAELARSSFSWDRLWERFDGDEQHLNIAHECLDRHDPRRVAARIAYADGRAEELSFGQIAAHASRFAHLLEDMASSRGDRVGRDGRSLSGVLRGAVRDDQARRRRGPAVHPLRPGRHPRPARRLRGRAAGRRRHRGAAARSPTALLRYDTALARAQARRPGGLRATTSARDLAVLQYTSGTSRQLPEAVPHGTARSSRSCARPLFALGLDPPDRYFCPSSPAWGHGLWHGTVAPWSLGAALGSYSGRFSIDRLVDALTGFQITNLAAASTIYRMLLRSGRLHELTTLTKASYTGEELTRAHSRRWKARDVGVPVCGMYGTTETGVIIGTTRASPTTSRASVRSASRCPAAR